MHHSITTPRVTPARSIICAVLGLTMGLALMALAPSAHARASDPPCVPRSSSTSWQSAISSASTALEKALANIKTGHYGKATTQLRTMKYKTQIAHTKATALIGRPPTDPESDDPPGVTAVLRVGGFEHRVVMALVPLFSDPHGRHVVSPLASGLKQAAACREVMLDKVIALKPGKRDDYVDGLSDTLPSYKQELTAISTRLAADGLTAQGRTALTKVRAVVSATQTAMKRVFGGGE